MVKKSESHVSHEGSNESVKSLKVKYDFWKVATAVLGVLLVVLLLANYLLNPKISASEAEKVLIAFAAEKGVALEVVSTVDKGDLYEITASVQGQTAPFYVTKDGKYFTSSVLEITPSASTSTNPSVQTTPQVIKSDKPKVELFVMSHCPYGTQVEKGMLPVAALLGDKIDFEVKFVYYVMHGEVEVKEQLNQYCIQKEQNAKYLTYLKCFLGEGDTASCLTQTGIDKTKLNSCVAKADAEFKVTANFKDKASWLSGQFPKFDIHKEDNTKYGVAGSPTVIINGAEVQSGRDAVSLLNIVCAAFNNAPEECNTQLDATTPAPGFGWDAAGNSNLAACGI